MNFTTLNHSMAPQCVPTTGWVNIVTGIILYSIVVVTIFGNLLVLIAVYVNKNLQTTFNYYVVNLAVTDFAVAVTAMSLHTTDNVLGYWPFGGFLCGVWIFFDYGMTFMSVFTLILISVDIFWSVTWTSHYRRYHTKRKSIICIVCIWIFMLFLWLPSCIYDRVHNAKPDECIWTPSENKGFVIVVAIIGHHGSCCVMFFCYLKVFITMRKHCRTIATEFETRAIGLHDLHVPGVRNGRDNRLSSSHFGADQNNSVFTHSKPGRLNASDMNVNMPSSMNAVRGKIHHLPTNRRKRDTDVFVTLTYIVIGYAVCWIPFHVVFDISSFCPSCVPRHVYAVTFWMTYINSTINPFLYNYSNPEFKRTFKNLLYKC